MHFLALIKRLDTLCYHPTDHADEQKRIKVSLQRKVSAPQVNIFRLSSDQVHVKLRN